MICAWKAGREATLIGEIRFELASNTGTGSIRGRVWLPAGPVRMAVQLVHGMAEHIARYDGFAKWLNERGILAVGHDHAGHGESAPSPEYLGYFAREQGWQKVVADLGLVCCYAKRHCPDVPYAMLGHSMGSFLTRSFAAAQPNMADAYVLCGTAGKNPALPLARVIVRAQARAMGLLRESALLDRLSFGSYNRRIPHARTKFDWLSRDEGVVERYVADPLCGFVFKVGGFRDLFDGLGEISAPGWAGKTAQKPYMLIAGTADPVGGYGAGPNEVARALQEAGRDVTLRLYEGARHELLNEINREEVYGDILRFFEEKVMV